MPTYNVKGFDGLAAALKRDLPRLVRKPALRAARKAAIDAAHFVAQNVPVAFGELRASIHVETDQNHAAVIADAPHAAAVEMGSRPHVVPLDALLKWVKLRGAQGLSKTGRVRSAGRKAWGTTTAEHSYRIATAIKAAEQNRSVDVDEPLRIAKAIQAAIAKRGTRPHFFMRGALPTAKAALAVHMEIELHGESGRGAA